MRISSPIHRKHARIEIIPLIDIMFFLLASFMMVSLNMTKVENIHVNPPAAISAEADFGADMLHIAVDQAGGVWVQKQPITLPDLYKLVKERFQHDEKVGVYIGGDAETRHGDMVRVLETVRNAGVQKIAFTVTAETAPKTAQPAG